MEFKDFEKLMTQEERDKEIEEVVAEMFPNLPKRRNKHVKQNNKNKQV